MRHLPCSPFPLLVLVVAVLLAGCGARSGILAGSTQKYSAEALLGLKRRMSARKFHF